MSHESTASKSVVWLTPLSIIDALGGAETFDLDPCAAPDPRPWPTAKRMNAQMDGNGLMMDWHGRVWLNPPYDGDRIAGWLSKMAQNNCGTALLAVRTENEAWHEHVWPVASAILFLRGRVRFHRPDGALSRGRPGHASALVAYGDTDFEWLESSGLDGHFQPLGSRRAAACAVDRLPGL